MLKNYLKIAIRNLTRNKGYTFINVVGLAVGIACCIIIGLYVKQQLSYDEFHEKAEQIYRLGTEGIIGGEHLKVALSAAPVLGVLERKFPSVVGGTRLFTFGGDALVKVDNQQFFEDKFFFADSTFFKVFSFKLLKGEPGEMLNEPNTVVLTKSMAKKYFGNQNPLGKTITFDGDKYRITGIMADIPVNSHMHFDFLASMSSLPMNRMSRWMNHKFYTYIVLAEGASAETLESKLAGIVRTYVAPRLEHALGVPFEVWKASGGDYRLFLQPLTGIHLRSHLRYEIEPNGSITYVYVFGFIAIFILLLACINFINLTTARSMQRTNEISVRKAIGAQRSQLAGQFLGEAVLISLAALLVGLVLIRVMLPAVNEIIGTSLSPAVLYNGPYLLALLGLTILVGLISGSYPALLLSGFEPAAVLRSESSFHAMTSSKNLLRRGLVVFQFAVSIIILVGTFVIYQQLDFMQTKNLGFSGDQVVVIGQADVLDEQQYTFQQVLEKQPGIQVAALSSTVPGRLTNLEAFQSVGIEGNQTYEIYQMHGSYDLVETLGLTIIRGRNFSRERGAGSAAVLLNETAVEKLGWTNPIGKQIKRPGPRGISTKTFTIIGIVEDFNFQSLRQPIRPLAIILQDQDDQSYAIAKIAPKDTKEALHSMKVVWDKFVPNVPFRYSFLDEDFAALHRASVRAGHLAGIFSVLAILIACLGLFGLATHAAERRVKEIGIRKVMGATVTNIVKLLSKDFLKLVLIGFVIAVPVAWYFMHQWLQDFAFRIDIGVGIFLLAGGLALLIALATVSWQSVRAALTNPVDSLRSE